MQKNVAAFTASSSNSRRVCCACSVKFNVYCFELTDNDRERLDSARWGAKQAGDHDLAAQYEAAISGWYDALLVKQAAEKKPQRVSTALPFDEALKKHPEMAANFLEAKNAAMEAVAAANGIELEGLDEKAKQEKIDAIFRGELDN